MTSPAPAMLEEIDDCIARIAAFQKSSGRRVAKLIKKSRKGREGLATLAGFGLPIPEDFAALYDHFDCVTASARLSFWETTGVLDSFRPERIVGGGPGLQHACRVLGSARPRADRLAEDRVRIAKGRPAAAGPGSARDCPGPDQTQAVTRDRCPCCVSFRRRINDLTHRKDLCA